MTENNTKILLESYSPICPLVVIVEENICNTYMYLTKINIDTSELEDSIPILVTAWIRNHVGDKSSSLDKSTMESGLAPNLPGEFCNHPEGKQRFKATDLECVWFEDGNGVALLEKEEILCIIPSWASKNYPPYSRDCIKENSLAVPLLEENILIDTVKKAQEFKEFIITDGCLEWFIDERYELFETYLGECRGSYASENKTAIINRILKFESGDITYLITASASLHMQPTVELVTDIPEDLRRVEVGLAIKTDIFKNNEIEIANMLSYTALMPWRNITWIGHGHTIECFEVFSKDNSYPYGVFINSKEVNLLPQIEFPNFRGDPINLLWLTPISQKDFEFIKDQGIREFLNKAMQDERSLVLGINEIE